MTFSPARPRYTLPFAGEEYELLGTFGLIEAVETAGKANVGSVMVQIVNGMPSSELAKIVAAMISQCGHPMTAKEAGDLIWNKVGLAGDDNDALRLHLYSFLAVCLAPPNLRAEKAAQAGEMLGRLASSGSDTAKSASESSAGPSQNSSPPTLGA